MPLRFLCCWIRICMLLAQNFYWNRKPQLVFRVYMVRFYCTLGPRWNNSQQITVSSWSAAVCKLVLSTKQIKHTSIFTSVNYISLLSKPHIPFKLCYNCQFHFTHFLQQLVDCESTGWHAQQLFFEIPSVNQLTVLRSMTLSIYSNP